MPSIFQLAQRNKRRKTPLQQLKGKDTQMIPSNRPPPTKSKYTTPKPKRDSYIYNKKALNQMKRKIKEREKLRQPQEKKDSYIYHPQTNPIKEKKSYAYTPKGVSS